MRLRVDGSRIVVARPFFDVGVARVSRISDRFESATYFTEHRISIYLLERFIPNNVFFLCEEVLIYDAPESARKRVSISGMT